MAWPSFCPVLVWPASLTESLSSHSVWPSFREVSDAQPVCPPLGLPVCQSVRMKGCMSASLSTWRALSVCLSTWRAACLPECLSACSLSDHLKGCLSAILSTWRDACLPAACLFVRDCFDCFFDSQKIRLIRLMFQLLIIPLYTVQLSNDIGINVYHVTQLHFCLNIL